MSVIEIEDSLLAKAKSIQNHKSDKETVVAALKEYIRHHEQQKIFHLFGKIEYNRDYSYKDQRSKS